MAKKLELIQVLFEVFVLVNLLRRFRIVRRSVRRNTADVTLILIGYSPEDISVVLADSVSQEDKLGSRRMYWDEYVHVSMDSGSWELRDDVLNFELCVILIVAVSVTAHALFAWKSIFHQAGGLFVVLGERYCSGSQIWGIRRWCSGTMIVGMSRGPVSPLLFYLCHSFP